MEYKYKSKLKEYIKSFLNKRLTECSNYNYQHSCYALYVLDNILVKNEINDITISEQVIYEWQRSFKCSSSTISSYTTILRGFCKYISGYGIKTYIPPHMPKKDNDYMAYIYSNEDLLKIFNISDNFSHFKTFKYHYVKFIVPMVLRLLYGCGLRLNEALNIRINDINFVKKAILIRKTKNKKERVVPMHESLFNILNKYCISMHLIKKCNPYIFPGTNIHNHIPDYSIREYFNYIIKKIGIVKNGKNNNQRGACIHCLRHTFAQNSFMQGKKDKWCFNDQIPWLSIYLGHNSLSETEKYLNFHAEFYNEEMSPFEKLNNEVFPEVKFYE